MNIFLSQKDYLTFRPAKWWPGFLFRSPGHYYGKGERPNTGLADNSPFIGRYK